MAGRNNNVTYHNPIHQEENTPLVTILDVKLDTKQATAIDSRRSPYSIDLTKASFGGIYYPLVGSQWYLKKISGVWSLMARAPQQNPQLDPDLTPLPGETYIGGEGKTYVVGDLKVTGSFSAGGSDTDPDIGAIRIHPTNTPPPGWMICDGSAISRVTYSLLFSAIGTTYGSGDGSTTFNIPNIKGKVVVGQDSGQTEFDTLGETGGEKTHVLTSGELAGHTHAVGTLAAGNQSANHTHDGSTLATSDPGGHNHSVRYRNSAATDGSSRIYLRRRDPADSFDGEDADAADLGGAHTHTISGSTGNQSANHNHTLSGSTASTGSGTAHNNLQPYIALNFIIKAVGSFEIPLVTGDGLTDVSFNAVGSVSTDQGFTAIVVGDTNKRYIVHDDGKTEWGPGNNVVDTNLYRELADTLATDDSIHVTDVTKALKFGATGSSAQVSTEKTLTTDYAYSSRIVGETNSRWAMRSTGQMEWGSGSATADTLLYRSAADTLKTDDTFIAAGGLVAKTVEIDPSAPNGNGAILRYNSGNGKYVSTSEEAVAMYPNVVVGSIVPLAGAISNSTTTNADITGASVSFTKNKAGTKVLIQLQGSCWFTSGGTSGGRFAVRINSVDYDVARLDAATAAGSHISYSGSVLVSGLAAGTYTVQGRYRSQAPGSVVNIDTGDYAHVVVTEVK